MASSDVLLVTSLFEGFPNVVLEAMAYGCPVASTDYSDVRRILPPALQVSATREPHELADIVERCVEQRTARVAAQRESVEEHATLERADEALLAVYRGYPRFAGRGKSGGSTACGARTMSPARALRRRSLPLGGTTRSVKGVQ